MAVYERTYRSYTGALTAPTWRFLVLPKYSVREVFDSKLFIAFLVACFIAPLVMSILIYIPHNSSFIKLVETMSGESVSFRVKASHYFFGLMIPQGFFCFFMALIIGPAQISADLRNNALPLYLSRPFSRPEYLLGKSLVQIFLLSAISWVPGLTMFALQAYLEGLAWLRDNLRIGAAIFFSCWVWILVLCLLSLALSAYVKWRPVARAAMFAVFLVLPATAAIFNFLFRTEWGNLINITHTIGTIWTALFGLDISTDLPIWSAWLSAAGFCSFCILLLARKVKAYEVVRS